MTIKNYSNIFLLIALCATNILRSETAEKKETVKTEKARKHAIDIEKKYKVKVADQAFLDSIKKGDQDSSQEKSSKAPSLTQDEIHRIAFSLIPNEDDESEEIIDDKVVEKLLLMGSSDQRDFFLKTVFNGHIATGFGATQAMLTLSNPTTNLSTLQNRQQAIDALDKNRPLVQLIAKELHEIGDAEKKSLLPFQTEKSVLEEGKEIPNENEVTFIVKRPFLNDAIILGYLGWQGLQMYNFLPAASSSYQIIKKGSINRDDSVEFVKCAFFFGLAGHAAQKTNSFKNRINNLEPIYTMLKSTKQHVQALDNLSNLVQNNPGLLTRMPSLQPLADFNNREKHSADFNSFIDILSSYDFESEFSLFSRKGPTIAADTFLKSMKQELIPVFAAAGELDMYVALAKLYEKNEHTQTPYCMPSFVENSSTPLLDAHNFWNPYLTADQAVTNSIIFDESNPNAVITGPNTGGKSTTMKALMLNALMAQSFGIAPSESLKLTPFSKMACLMNSSDDIANATSLFKAEAINANEYLCKAENLKENEFGLFSFDEIFTGTSPEVGERATRQYAEKIAKQKNAIILLATHYKDIANKRKNRNSRYNNFHMELKTDENGNLERTYKLKKGESSVNIAFEIIKETGLNIETEKQEEPEKNLTPLFFR